MGGFNPVLGGLAKGFAMAQLIKEQAIAEASEQRAKEQFERQKAIENAEFKIKVGEIGGRAATGGDKFQQASGKMLTPTDRIEIDPTTGRRTVVPGFAVAESDIRQRMIKSPDGTEFVLPTDAEIEAKQRRQAREALQAEAAKKQLLGDIEAVNKGKAKFAEKSAEEQFEVADDERAAKAKEEEDERKRLAKEQEDARAAEQKRLDRESQRALEAMRQKGSDARTASVNATRKYVAELQASDIGKGANVDKEIEELDDLTAEIEAVDTAINDGEVKGVEAKLAEIKQNRRVQRQKQLLDIINRKRKLAEGSSAPNDSGETQINKLRGGRGGRSEPGSGGGLSETAEKYLRKF